MGLNTPATTIFSFGLLLIAQNNIYELNTYLLQLPTLLILVGVLSFLLIAEIPLFSFKFKNLSWAGNEVRFVFILMAILLLIFMPLGLALVAAISLYLTTSLLFWGDGKAEVVEEFVGAAKGSTLCSLARHSARPFIAFRSTPCRSTSFQRYP